MSTSSTFSSSLRLPVKITNGFVTLMDGTSLPALHKETCADLILDASSLVHDADRLRLTQEASVEIIGKGTALWARVKLDDIPASLRAHRESKKSSASSPAFVKFVLDAPLRLIGSEGKQPILSDCACRIPSLPHVVCASVNEAYTRISEAFEPSRRSHTGNVFSCVFFDSLGILQALKKLRNTPLKPPAVAGQASLF
jgi:hypothetical protein